MNAPPKTKTYMRVRNTTTWSSDGPQLTMVKRIKF